MEETALRSLKELEVKQDQRRGQLNDLFSEIKENEISRHEKDEKIREENKRKANEEHRMKMTENEVWVFEHSCTEKLTVQAQREICFNQLWCQTV